MGIRFRAKEVVRIRHETVSAVMTGHLLDGELTFPTVLRDERTNAEVRIRGFEQLVDQRDPEILSLLIDKASPTLPVAGMVLVDPA